MKADPDPRKCSKDHCKVPRRSGHVHKALHKDYIGKIDFQDPFFAVVNWPISELYGWASVSIMHNFDQSATNQLANVFLFAGCGFLQILIQI